MNMNLVLRIFLNQTRVTAVIKPEAQKRSHWTKVSTDT